MPALDAIPATPPTGRFRFLLADRLQVILWASILLRVGVYAYLDYSNPDPHWQVVDYLYRTGRLPLSHEFSHAFHPPLYFILAAPLLFTGSFKVVQLLSLLTSIMTVGMAARTIRRSPAFRHKAVVFAFFCLLPELVTFSLFISNDSLAFLLGVVMVYQVERFIREPSGRRASWLAVFVGLGLSTKMTFLVYVPVVAGLIGWLRYRQARRWGPTLGSLSLALLIMAGLGGYKLVENAIHQGRPVVHNMDFNPLWAEQQRPTYVGFVDSVLNIDVTRLIRNPTLATLQPGPGGRRIETTPSIKHSYPLLLYATFYYSWIPGESNFGAWRSDLRYVGSAIYALAVVPTLLMVLGLWGLGRDARAVWAGADDGSGLLRLVVAAFFILNTALVVRLGVKYDAWSCFQSRLMFPSLLGAIVLLDGGLTFVRRAPPIQRASVGLLIILEVLFAAYLLMEVALIAWSA